MVDPREKVEAGFERLLGRRARLIARAPGRVNLIGEHTDYNDGFVLPMAIGCGTYVAAAPRDDAKVQVVALDFGEAVNVFDLSGIVPDPEAPWSNYVRGVAQALIEDGLALRGADLVLSGDVPKGAGLSSSASLEVAAGLALAALAGHSDYDRTMLALAGQKAEHEFAGCKCGIMDQLVSARAEAGAALLIDCRDLTSRPVGLGDDLAVMIVHSGIERGLVDGEYNARRAQCEAAARHFGLAALRDVQLEQIEGAALDQLTLQRARHVVTENARVLLAEQALGHGSLADIGALMAASHASMRDDFGITTPEIDALVELLQSAIGSEGGARMTGGGFGGAVVALLRQNEVERVKAHVEAGYRTPGGAVPLIMIEKPCQGASLI